MSETTGFGKHLAIVIVCAGLAFGWLGFILIESGWFSQVTGSGYKVHVIMPTAATLTSGDRVTMAGIDVGQITGVQRENGDVRVDISLSNHKVYPLPADSTAQIRQHTPVGENYLSIVPGNSKQMMPSGGTIPLDQTDQYVDVDQVLSTLRGQTKTRAREIFESMGPALNGRGAELNSVIGQGGSAIDNVAVITHQTLYPERQTIGSLVDQLGNLFSAIGDRNQAITTLANQAFVGLSALKARDSSLSATLDRLPQTLTSLHSLAGTLQTVSHSTAPVVEKLASAVTAVRPAVRDLPPAANQARTALSALSAASPKLANTLKATTKLAPRVVKTLPTIKSTLCQLDPTLNYLNDPEDVIAILAGLGSGSNAYDDTGHLLRLYPIVGDESAAGLPDSVEQAQLTLIHAGLLGTSNATQYQAFPPRNSVGLDSATNSGIIGPAGEKATGYKYPHVVAGDCS